MTVSLSPLGGAGWQFFTDGGVPLAGGKLYTYGAGGTTPANTYTSSSGGTANANPIVLDSAGRPSAEVWLTDGTAYKFVVADSSGTTIRTYDNISGIYAAGSTSSLAAQLAASNGASLVGFIQSGTGATATTELLKDQQDLSPMDFGAVGNNNGTVGNGTDDTAAITAMAAAWPNRMANGAGRSFRVGATLPSPSIPAGTNLYNGQVVSNQMVTTQDEYSVTVFGYGALANNTYIPEQNAASGGRYFADGNHIVALGRQALAANTTGRRNVAVGSRSMLGNTTGYYNTALGSHTMESATTGYENVAVGTQALQSMTNAIGNTAVGLGAGNKISSGSNNTGVGWGAMAGASASVCTGNTNAAVGYRALYSATTATDNAALGADALVSLTQGQENTSVGRNTLIQLTTESYHTAVGSNALRQRVTTGGSTAVGAYALTAATSGGGGDAFGYQSQLATTTGAYNSSFGYQSLILLTTGSNNVAVGRAAGGSITTGSGNTMIGYSADSTIASSNSTSLGNGATCTGDNQITLGNSSIATIRAQVTTITALSDERFKKNVRDVVLPDAFLEELRIVLYEWIDLMMPQGDQVGVLAQELDALQIKHGVEWLGLVDKTNPDRWEATPGKLLFPLLHKFGQVSRRVAATEARLDALEAK